MTWRVTVYTDMPSSFPGPLATSLVGRALQSNIWNLDVVDLRTHAANKTNRIDHTPAGGGPGMVLRPDVVNRALRAQGLQPPSLCESNNVTVSSDTTREVRTSLEGGLDGLGEEADRFDRTGHTGHTGHTGRTGHTDRTGHTGYTGHTGHTDRTGSTAQETYIVCLTPRGKVFTQALARTWSRPGVHVHIVSSRFEGMDQRVVDHWAMEELSIGDYVLCSGDLAAMVMIEACVRLLPDVLGNPDSLAHESFSKALDGGLEYPQYTAPAVWEGRPIPPVLLSGHHERIATWRGEQALLTTRTRRRDLISISSAPAIVPAISAMSAAVFASPDRSNDHALSPVGDTGDNNKTKPSLENLMKRSR